MAIVEDAAALFGSDDPGLDPFARLGAGEEDTTEVSPGNGQLFGEQATPHPNDYFASGGSQQLYPDPAHGQASFGQQQHGSAGWSGQYEAPSHSQDLGTGGLPNEQTQSQGWHEEQHQWQDYGAFSETSAAEPSQNTAATGTYDPYATQTNNATRAYQDAKQQPQSHSQYDLGKPASYNAYTPSSSVTPAQSYEPYKPTLSAYNSAPQFTPSSVTAAQPYEPYKPAVSPYIPVPSQSTQSMSSATGQSVYEPYKPAVSPYNPPVARSTPTASAAPVQSAYQSYKPAISAYNPPSTPSYYANQTPYSLSAAAKTAIPQPPTPKATINRPKIVNAYDPPFPVSKPTRRPSARSVFATPPGSGQPPFSAYESYGAPAAQQAPPPAVAKYTTPSQPTFPPSRSTQDIHGSTPPQNAPSSAPVPPPAAHQSSSRISQNGHSAPQVNSYNVGAPELASAAPQASLRALSPPSNHQPMLSAPPVHFLPSSIQQGPTNAAFDIPHFDADSPQMALPSMSPPQQRLRSPPLSAHSEVTQTQTLSNSPRSDRSFPRDSVSTISSPQQSSYQPLQSRSPESFNGALQRTTSPGTWSAHSQEQSPVSNMHSAPMNQHNISTFQRSLSPPITGVNGHQSPPRQSPPVPKQVGSYPPQSYDSGHRALSPAQSLQRAAAPPQNTFSVAIPHNPYSIINPQLALGPLRAPIAPPSANPYEPGSIVSDRPPDRHRSMSNGSVNSSTSASDDRYAPVQHDRKQWSEVSDYGNYSSRYGFPNAPEGAPYGASRTQSYDNAVAQELPVRLHTQPQYAPSPSLLGSNDPLGRVAARVPVFSFGFGGKLITCFHTDSDLNTGFDVALSSRKSTAVHVRVLSKLIPESAIDHSPVVFPGPLFSDPGTPTTMSLVRTGATQTKTRKSRVLKYLSERADEVSRSIGYLHAGSLERRQAEGKLVLVKLLEVMVENDGRVSGTAQVDAAVRVALVPRLETSLAPLSQDASLSTTSGLSAPADSLAVGATALYGGVPVATQGSLEPPISVTTLLPSVLDKIQEFLLRGERQKAYHYALDQKLWAHAMVISSSIDKEAWQEAVTEFLRHDLGVKGSSSRLDQSGNDPAPTTSTGREALKVAYSLFSGQGAAAVQELVPQNLLARASGGALLPAVSQLTPRTPNFSSLTPTTTAIIPEDTLSNWADTAAMIYSNPLSAEASAALTALGDQLTANQWIEAAHACYLLSPQTSPLGGLGNPAARVILLGSPSPQIKSTFQKDPDGIIFTEIVEFAMSLASPVKGQELFLGLPHLQAYKLTRAISLAEMGQIQQANRYCDAIAATRTRSSPYFTPTFEAQLKGLSDRIVGAPHIDKSGSWIGGKMTKPSMDTIGTWLEGRFTKLITGDGDESPLTAREEHKPEERAFSGPFSHYSTISSATTSNAPSPQSSTTNLNSFAPPRRTGSAMDYTSAPSHYTQIDRASSAVDFTRRNPSPTPHKMNGTANNGTPYRSSIRQPVEHPTTNGTNSQYAPKTPNLSQVPSDQAAPLWGSSYIEDTSIETPTVPNFLLPNDASGSSLSSSGFISLMDNEAIPLPAPRQRNSIEEEDEEDLGFGNPKRREDKKSADSDDKSAAAADMKDSDKPVPVRPDLKETTASSGSWISRLWKRDSTPAPVKASLGDETSFYYDKDLKRWVNKKAGAEESPKSATPPPPPSRAQTASPAKAAGMHSNGHSIGPPPLRSASAVDFTFTPPSATTRTRSNLVPSETAPNSPLRTSTLTPPPPPPGRPKSQASKRNIRSRYVDVFQQESTA